jgi:hypothetical protein
MMMLLLGRRCQFIPTMLDIMKRMKGGIARAHIRVSILLKEPLTETKQKKNG